MYIMGVFTKLFSACFFSSYSNLLLQIMYASTRKAFPYNINEGFP